MLKNILNLNFATDLHLKIKPKNAHLSIVFKYYICTFTVTISTITYLTLCMALVMDICTSTHAHAGTHTQNPPRKYQVLSILTP